MLRILFLSIFFSYFGCLKDTKIIWILFTLNILDIFWKCDQFICLPYITSRFCEATEVHHETHTLNFSHPGNKKKIWKKSCPTQFQWEGTLQIYIIYQHIFDHFFNALYCITYRDIVRGLPWQITWIPVVKSRNPGATLECIIMRLRKTDGLRSRFQ